MQLGAARSRGELLVEQPQRRGHPIAPGCVGDQGAQVRRGGHKDSPTGVLVQVLDQARLGGVENVSIAATGN
jgi:hypothetical protein